MRKKTSSSIAGAKIAIIKKMNSTSAKGARIHVISQESKWAVRMEGSQKAYRICMTKEGAVKTAKNLVKNGLTQEIVIHKKDGSIERQVKSPIVSDEKAVVLP